MNKKLKRAAIILTAVLVTLSTVTALASEPAPVPASAGDPVEVVNNLTGFLATITRAVGIIMLLFGMVNLGISLKNHDPSSRANALLTMAGGLIVTFAKEILGLIGVTI